MESKTPDRAELRNFGLLLGAIFAGLFGVLLPWLKARQVPRWPWVLLVVLWIPALLAPRALSPIRRAWTAFGEVMGWVNSRMMLGAIFYLVVVPAGFLMRAFGGDPMARRFEDSLPSYRVPSKQAPREGMERPF